MHRKYWDYNFRQRYCEILGDAENLHGKLAGIVTSCMEKHWRSDMTREEAILYLEKHSIYHLDTVIDWIAKEGPDYIDYLRYLTATENMRLAAINYLRKA